MGSNPGEGEPLLVEVRRRRAELRSSMGALERALAAPARAGGSAGWVGRLRDALAELYDDVGEHVAITEGPEGLYEELTQHSPRLARAVERLTAEHAEIVRRLDELVTLVDTTDEAVGVARARRAGTELLVVLVQHRQQGADLVFEAYDLDIGGET